MEGIVLHIGISSIRGAVFSVEKKKSEHLLPHMKETYHVAGAITTRLEHHLGHILPLIRRDVSSPPAAILISLATPYYKAKITRIAAKRTNPTRPITIEEIQTILRKGSAGWENLEVFTQAPLKVFVNGYPVGSMTGMRGQTIEVLTRYEAAKRELRERITELLQQYALHSPHTHMFLTGTPLAYAETLGELMRGEHDTLLIDIGGELTEVSHFENGTLRAVTTIPQGSTLVVRRVASLLNVSFHDALFITRRFITRTLEANLALRVENTVGEALDIWKKALGREMPTLAHRIFLTSEESLLASYKAAVTGFGKDINVQSLHPEALREKFGKYCCFTGASDFKLACLVLLLAKILYNKQIPWHTIPS